jgi:hypothetical protein
MDKAGTSEMRDAKKIVRDKFLAVLTLSRANREKYGELKRSLAENYVTRTSKYPKSPEVVLCFLSAYTLPPGWNRCLKQEGGVRDKRAMFVQLDGRDDSGKKTYRDTIARRRGISNGSVQEKRPTSMENKSM